MDHVQEIKSRLPIEQLVGRYVQLTKKGRNFVGLCPFHQDSHPSFLVSPDKGICYCFPCQKGGDIFSFFQLIEGVDFPQALKDLADIAGVDLPEARVETVPKDEKDRMRDCLTSAASLYQRSLAAADGIRSYLRERGVTDAEIAEFGLGFAPDSFSATYDHLLKSGYSKSEVLGAGLAVQKDLQEGKMYDRFRNRLMFPIHDARGQIIGFGGRTMGDDQAKYLNGSDSILYRKSSVLYGLHKAMPAIREQKQVILVEGYFDVLACHRAGVLQTVATCGTALTEEHVRLLKRSAERVTLCLDQDRAGRDAAERAFLLCSKEGLQIDAVVLPQKDPADMAQTSLDELGALLRDGPRPYLDIVLDEIRALDLQNPMIRKTALERLLPLLQSILTATERTHAIRQAADALGTTEAALTDDLQRFKAGLLRPHAENEPVTAAVSPFTSAELALGLLLLYPRNLHLIKEMIPPIGTFDAALYASLKVLDPRPEVDIDALPLDDDQKKRVRILLLYCEENGMGEWSEAVATREIRTNCRHANREQLIRKQKDITRQLLEARREGKTADESVLASQYQQLINLARNPQ